MNTFRFRHLKKIVFFPHALSLLPSTPRSSPLLISSPSFSFSLFAFFTTLSQAKDSKVSIKSTWTVKAEGGLIEDHRHSNSKTIELTPWDILELQNEYIQDGVLYGMPTYQQVRDLSKATNTSCLIDHLRVSLARALGFFYPFCGRLEVVKEHQSKTTSFFINCNNAGVRFIHAIAEGVSVDDILKSNRVPHHVVQDLFPLNGVQNQEGTTHPFLGVQVTELVDGIVIGCAWNHSVADGSSFWDFYGSWADMSLGSNVISKIPSFERRFPFKIDNCFSNRISIPSERLITNAYAHNRPEQTMRLGEKVFHITKESVGKLKAKANLEMNTTKISTLQAVLAHVWRSVMRCRRRRLHQNEEEEETTFEVSINMRERLNPPLPDVFFGNAVYPAIITLKTADLLEHQHGWAALQINNMIASHDHEKFNCIYQNWMKDPEIQKPGDLPRNYFMLYHSPRFNFYKYDFGWGKPISYRSGNTNMMDGKITVLPGLEKGSMILEICLSLNTMQALEEDQIFFEFVTTRTTC